MSDEPVIYGPLIDIVELGVLRDLRPDDILVVKVARSITPKDANTIKEIVERNVCCKVLVVDKDIQIGTPKDYT